MSCMVTITHNDGVSEMLANIRRGPFSEPTEAEKCEYLFTRVKSAQQRPNFEDYALEHVIPGGGLKKGNGAECITYACQFAHVERIVLHYRIAPRPLFDPSRDFHISAG